MTINTQYISHTNYRGQPLTHDMSIQRFTIPFPVSPSVALKSVAEEAMPPQIPQMLLVLQGVHRLPPTDDYFTLVSLLPYVVKPYQCLVPRLRNLITEPESKLLTCIETLLSLSGTHNLSPLQ